MHKTVDGFPQTLVIFTVIHCRLWMPVPPRCALTGDLFRIGDSSGASLVGKELILKGSAVQVSHNVSIIYEF